MAVRVTTPPGAQELTDARTAFSKTFRLADGKTRVSTKIRRAHRWDGTQWVDYDTALVRRGNAVDVVSADYTLEYERNVVGITVRANSKATTLRLVAVDDVPLGPIGFPTLDGERAIWADVRPGVDIELRTRPAEIEFVKHLRTALHRLTWEVIEDVAEPLLHNAMTTAARDNADVSATSRITEAEGNKSRKAEIGHTRSPDDLVTYPGRRTYRITEEVTGRTRWRDPVTRVPEWRNDIAYPVEIDASVTVNITATDDDGWGEGNPPAWQNHYGGLISWIFTNDYQPAFRFQTVNVPQGATIDSATLTFRITTAQSAYDSYAVGNDVDDAAAWTNGSANGPQNMAKTTAVSATFANGPTGLKAITVTSIIQEIVNRAGWAANQDLRIGIVPIDGASLAKIEDYSNAGTDEAQLDITYTAGGGRTTKNTRSWPLGTEIGMGWQMPV